MEKKQIDMEYILYGERRPGSLGLVGQAVVAILKYLLRPDKLTIGDANRLNDIHERTGMSFPIKAEKFIKK